ncbi:MAG: hypothetical protein ACTSP4_02130, partial [Candidatus Hodarchaeales archaeon]
KNLAVDNSEEYRITERQINRFKGLLKLKGKVLIEEIARSFNMTNFDVEQMIYELVGSGIVQLTLVDGCVSIPEDHDVDSVINDLGAAFIHWEANIDKKTGKIRE